MGQMGRKGTGCTWFVRQAWSLPRSGAANNYVQVRTRRTWLGRCGAGPGAELPGTAGAGAAPPVSPGDVIGPRTECRAHLAFIAIAIVNPSDPTAESAEVIEYTFHYVREHTEAAQPGRHGPAEVMESPFGYAWTGACLGCAGNASVQGGLGVGPSSEGAEDKLPLPRLA